MPSSFVSWWGVWELQESEETSQESLMPPKPSFLFSFEWAMQ